MPPRGEHASFPRALRHSDTVRASLACPPPSSPTDRECFSSAGARPRALEGDAARDIRSRERPDGDVKELRVKIDVSYHLKLHALKLLRNKKMSDAIEEALDYYFEHVVQAGPDLDQDEQAKRLF